MPCRNGQIKPMIKQAKVGKMNNGNHRWIGRRIILEFIAAGFFAKTDPSLSVFV